MHNFLKSLLTGLLIPLFVLLLMVPGCKRPQYTPHSFDGLRPQKTITMCQVNVTLSIALLSKQETTRLFDNRGNRLYAKRHQICPLLIAIKNESNCAYRFDPKSLQCKLCRLQKIARRLHSHTTRRILGPLVLGSLGATICFFGAAYLVILGTIQHVAMPALVKAGYAMLGVSGIIALGTPVICYQQGAYSYRINQSIDQDVRSKMVSTSLDIDPGAHISFLIFTEKRSCPTEWNIILTDTATCQPLVFNFCLSKEGALC